METIIKHGYETLTIKDIKARCENVDTYRHTTLNDALSRFIDRDDLKIKMLKIEEYKRQGDSESIYKGELTSGKNIAKSLKSQMPRLFPGSEFNTSGLGPVATRENFIGNDGYVLVDIDAQDYVSEEEMNRRVIKLLDDKYVWVLFPSVSNTGYKVIIPCYRTSTWEQYKSQAIQIMAYLKLTYDVIVDGSSMLPTMGTYMGSLDKDELYINPDAETFDVKYPDTMLIALGFKRREYVATPMVIDSQSLSVLVRHSYVIESYLADSDYMQWFSYARALYNTYGQQAKDLFLSVSSDAGEAESKWKTFRSSKEGNAGVGTLLNPFKERMSREDFNKFRAEFYGKKD